MKLSGDLLNECNLFKAYKHKNLSEIDLKLYHYTNIYALRDIFKNKSLWLTKADYMNDSQEVVYATNKISNACINILDFNSKCYNKIMEYVLRPNQYNFGAFIISFSKNYDSLTLWSNYSNMEGYNIGFSSVDLYNATKISIENTLNPIFTGKNKVKLGKDYNIVIDDVIYNEKLQKKIVMEIINKMKCIMLYFRKAEISAYQTDKLLVLLAKRLQRYINLFKQQNFESERESRMIITFENENIINNILEHRISNGALIPYIEVKFNPEISALPFAGMTIGPRNNSDLAVKGVKSFLLKNNLDIKDEEIVKSSIPLRF